jgi:outer membrane protein TolC
MNTGVLSNVHTYLSFLMFLLLASPIAAQNPPPQAGRLLSLEEALELAEGSSEQIAIARAGVERAGGELVRARAERYPQLSGTASYDRALASEFSGIFTDTNTGVPCAPFVPVRSRSVDERLIELERAVDCGATGVPPDDGLGNFEDLPFGRKNTYRINLAFSQLLYSGGRLEALSAIAAAARENADITLTSSRAQVLLDVVRAYYDAALSGRMLEIAEATYQQADATYAQTRLGFEAGSQPEFELLRAQVARDTQRPIVIRRRSDRDIALLRLRQLLDLPAGQPLVLTTALDGDTLPPPAPFAAALVASETSLADASRATVRQAETAVRLSDASVEVARSQRRPSVSVTSTYGEVAYPSGTLPGFGDFRRNWNVGAAVQMPILNGGRLRADEMIARADAQEARARLQQVRENTLVDTRTAYEEMSAALAAWEASAGTVQQAQRAYEISELRYREGVSTQLELSDSRLLLVLAQASRAQAARDLQVARARVALLPDLPVGAGTPGFTVLPAAPQPVQQPQPAAAGAPRGTGGIR